MTGAEIIATVISVAGIFVTAIRWNSRSSCGATRRVVPGHRPRETTRLSHTRPRQDRRGDLTSSTAPDRDVRQRRGRGVPHNIS